MPSAPTAIGPFHIERELGRGGMGVVYLARDSRLDRAVAIKALPDHLMDDPDRLARFQREAKVLASLNHPGIGAIYGLESHEKHQYLVLEYIEGETLAEILKRGAIPLDDALPIAKHIAEAVEAAHTKGIVHRDLKPGNVMITPEGKVKVLDFGLARTAEGPVSSVSNPALSQSPTLTSPVHIHSPTIAGAIMGTAGYMSPEQARGKPVDKRSDIFSFGCILYEMLSGSRPFVGETVSDSVAATLHLHPDLGVLAPSTPRAVVALLKRCLAKDREHRLQDIGDARVELEQIIADPDAGVAAGARGPWWRSPGVVAAVCLASLAIIIGALALRGTLAGGSIRGAVRPDVRASLVLPKGVMLHTFDRSIAVSPDGTTVVMSAYPTPAASATMLYLRDLSRLGFRPLEGTQGATYPCWSPDGRSIAFFAEERLKRIDLADGIVRPVCDALAGRGASWGSKGTIVFAPGAVGGLSTVSDAGGTPTPVTTPSDPKVSQRVPQMLPDGRRFLYFGQAESPEGVYAFDPDSGSSTFVLASESEAMYVDPGYLVFVRDNNLLVQPFDPRTFTLSGAPTPIATDVRRDVPRRFANLGISAQGTLVYEEASPTPRSRLAWMDRSGAQTPIAFEPIALASDDTVDIAPDGRRVVAQILNQRDQSVVALLDLDRGVQTVLVDHDQNATSPKWWPGAQRIMCISDTKGVQAIAAFSAPGPGERTVLASEDGFESFPGSVSADGRTLIFSRWSNKDKIGELMTVDLNDTKNPKPYIVTPVSEYLPELSTAGDCIAYECPPNDSMEVHSGTLHVITFPTPSAPVQVAPEPIWSAWGWLGAHELYWMDVSRRAWSASITVKDGQIDVAAPKPLIGGQPVADNVRILDYDQPHDRFLIAISDDPHPIPNVVIVTDWRRALATRGTGAAAVQ